MRLADYPNRSSPTDSAEETVFPREPHEDNCSMQQFILT
jgi:hypothetical protein